MAKKSPPKRSKSEKIRGASPARIKVVGVGGCGGNVVTRMSASPFRGVEFIAINTDVQDLNTTSARRKIHIGKNLTKGLGTGMNPDLGRQAAEENLDDIAAALEGADMIFVTAGMGGGTGTGAGPVVAEAAAKTGALTIGVVTKPFFFEGSQRMQVAEEGIARMRDKVDALITIPNDRIFTIIDSDTPLLKAFEKIDEILKNAVQGISELVTAPGLVNVDFADVRAVLSDSGTAVVGIGHASGKERALSAAKTAITSPLLESGVDGARGVLFGIAGGRDMRMQEINDAAKFITETVDAGSKIIFGAYHDRRLKPGALRITVLAAGFGGYGNKDNHTLGLFGENTRVDVAGNLFDRGASGSALQEFDTRAARGAGEEKDAGEAVESRSETASSRNESEKEALVTDDMWDIPAFLKKRGRNK